MKDYIAISGFILLSSLIVTSPTLAASDASNIITASSLRNRSLIDKTLLSEKDRIKRAQETHPTKYLDKKLSQLSWQEHTKISKVMISGNKSINTEQLKVFVQPYLKKGVTKKELEKISINIENYYQKQGYFLPVAHVEITNSVLQVKIIEGKIRNVLIKFVDEKRDKKVLKNQRFLDLIKQIEIADPMKTKDLERYLLLINKIHGYTVEYELEPLPQFEGNNVSDLLMQISTEKGTANLALDNKGSTSLGKYQLNFASQIFNPISNDSLTLNFATSNKPKNIHSITAGYLKRLNSYGTSASILTGYSRDRTHSSDGYNKSVFVKGQLSHYVVLNNANSFKLECDVENHDITNYSEQVKTRAYKYMLGRLGGAIKMVDPLGAENWFFPYYNTVILGNVDYSSSSSFTRNFSKNFNFITIDWYRDQLLPKNFSLFLKASYQRTDKLLPLEHIYSIGTHNTARGYKTGLVSNDQGISGMAELRYTKKFDQEKIKKFLNIGQVFVFYDVTRFIKYNKDSKRSRHADADYFNKSTLSSAGCGIRLFFPYEIYAEGTAEYPIIKNITVNDIKRKNGPLYRFLLSKEFNW